MEMIKEIFSMLLLGGDMTGSGQGVSAALAISKAITNLSTTTFGQLWKLEPLPVEKKEMWRRDMDWLLSIGDHIVEMVPSYKTFRNGTTLEADLSFQEPDEAIMTREQRSDLSIGIPALRKLDGMLLELLDGFGDAEFWYVDERKSDVDTDDSASFEKLLEGEETKWRLLVPRIPEDGLSKDSKTQLHRIRVCATQILKATMLINTDTISKMGVPESYLESLPKTGKACLGDQLYKFIASEKFSLKSMLDCLGLSAEHIVKELLNRLDIAIYVWHKKCQSRFTAASNYTKTRSSAIEADRRELFSARAEDLLLALKHQFPHLPRTALEATKIQCNKDVGKSILESYSAVLKTLACNIVARIDDLLYIETHANQPDKSVSPSDKMTPIHHVVTDIYPLHFTNASSRCALAKRSSSKPDIVHFLRKVHRYNRLRKRTLS